MLYSIFHPLDGVMNHDCQAGLYMYQHVFTLEANSLEEAFKLAQNDFNEQYAALGVRSTSVGDIIQSQADFEANECHLVKGLGFGLVPNTWLSFIDWGAIDGITHESSSQGYWGIKNGEMFHSFDYEESIGE